MTAHSRSVDELLTHPSISENSWPVLAAVCLAALVLPLSFSGGAVATPAVGRTLGGDPVSLMWITNAFMLSFGSSLMAAGTLADRFGRKRVFTAGLGLFAVTSLLLSIAPNVLVLDLLRALQGVAAAAALSGGSAALTQEFEGHARTKAFGLLGTTFGVGLAFGPIITGSLIQSLGWRAVFVATALIAIAALVFGPPRMRETKDPDSSTVDLPGLLTFTSTLSLFTFAMIEAPELGWTNRVVQGLFLGAAVSLLVFIVVERRVHRPMLDLSLFRYPKFVGVQILPVATCYCYVVLLVLLPLRFIGVEGYGEIDAGLMMLALSAPMLVVPLAAASATRWASPGMISSVGLVIAGFGLIWLASLLSHPSPVNLILPMLVIGLGTGMPWGLMDGLSVTVVPKERAGMATGIFSTTRVAGEGIALVIVAAILAALVQRGLVSMIAANGTGLVNPYQLRLTAAHIATADLRGAMTLLPSLAYSQLVAIYTQAFQSLLYILAAISFVSSIAIVVFLRDPKADTSACSGQMESSGR